MASLPFDWDGDTFVENMDYIICTYAHAVMNKRGLTSSCAYSDLLTVLNT